MFFEPLRGKHRLHKGVGVNKGYEMDVFMWCRPYGASRVIFWVNKHYIELFNKDNKEIDIHKFRYI